MASLDDAIGQMLAAGMPEFPPGHPAVGLGRITRYGTRKRAWYRLDEVRARSGRFVVVGAFGLWGRIDSLKIEVDWKGIAAEERDELRRNWAEQEAREAAKRDERAHLAANRAKLQWTAARASGVSPYLVRKGVEPVRGLKFFTDGTLLVPMLKQASATEKPELVGVQKIAPDGDKKFNAGVAKKGAWCRLGPGPTKGRPILVAEGVATALSIGQAIEWRSPVVVAFDAYNIEEVVKAQRALFPDNPLLICADDDYLTEGNPGITRARRAAANVTNAFVRVPLFRLRLDEQKLTDFNDLHATHGIDEVRLQIEQALKEIVEDASAPAKSISTPSAAGAGGGSGDHGGGAGAHGGGGEGDTPAEPPKWHDGMLRNAEGVVKGNWQNAAYALEHHPALAKLVGVDEFATCLVAMRPPPWTAPGDKRKHPREWSDADDAALGMWMSFSMTPRLVLGSVDGYRAGVNAAALKCRTHPLREWLLGLKWDGTPRLDAWLIDVCAPRQSHPTSAEYIRLVGRWFLIGAVMRILRPGCKLDHAPIFEGAQGQGKSTMLAVLAGDYFADTPFVMGDTNSYLALKGRWIYEIAELDSFNRSEQTRAKAFMSSSKDTYRAPYERRVADHQRQCVFGGTTNADEYFKDATGNRRYWPLHCGDVNLDALRDMREQLFAEAVHCAQEGERYWPLGDEQKRLFSPEQEEREIGDARLAVTALWLDGKNRHGQGVPGLEYLARVTTADILFDCWKVEIAKVDNTKALETKAGQIMQKLGWLKKRDSKSREYFYERPPARANGGSTEGDAAPAGLVSGDDRADVPF